MSNIQIPNLPTAIALTGAEQLEVVQNGVSSQCTTAQVAGLASTVITFVPPRIGIASATPTVLPAPSSSYDQINITLAASSVTVGAPQGSFTDGQKLVFRFNAALGAKSVTWGFSYIFYGGLSFNTTTSNKVSYVTVVKNAQTGNFDVISVVTQN